MNNLAQKFRKDESHLGDKMPQLPWMINFACPAKKECYLKSLEKWPPNQLEFLSNLRLERDYARSVLTTIACTLGTKNMDQKFLNRVLDESTGLKTLVLDSSVGSESDQFELLEMIRSTAAIVGEKCGREYPVAILIEMSGLRMRTGQLDSTVAADITLVEDAFVFLTFELNYECHCNKKMIYINNPKLLRVLAPGHRIYIDYGYIILEVVDAAGKKYKTIKCKVINGGKLRDEALIHLPNVPFAYENEVRAEIISFAVKNNVDGIIMSRTRNAHLIECVRSIVEEVDKPMIIIAKIEDSTGIANIDEIIEVSDAVIVARGELGIDLPPEKLFIAQKLIIAKCNKAGIPAICGAHFLKTMDKSRLPSRAEMLDVANSVLDGADAIFLSEDLTRSPYFFEAISIVRNGCLEAEASIFQKQELANLIEATIPHNIEPSLSLAISAIELCARTKATCIIVCTVSGRAAKLLSQFKPKCPIIAVTRYGHIARKLNLWRAVFPIYYTALPRADWIEEIDTRMNYAITYGKYAGLIKGGDPLVLLSTFKEMAGFTNTLRVVYATHQNLLKRTNIKKKPTSVDSTKSPNKALNKTPVKTPAKSWDKSSDKSSDKSLIKTPDKLTPIAALV